MFQVPFEGIEIKVSDLDKIGLNSTVIRRGFLIVAGKKLNLNEMIKVSSENEGKDLKFETLDSISVVVPVYSADGSWNKVD